MDTRPPLKEYQERAISYALENPYSILGLDCGLGKSRIFIEIREKLGGNCLVVCPSYLVNNWVHEIRKWAPPETVITAIQKGSQIYELVDTDYAIISYDLSQKAEHFFEWADLVAFDEAHALKSQKAKRTQYIHRVVYENSIKRLHLLTGTPIKNRVEEFFSLLALCNYSPHTPDSPFLEKYPSSIDFADHFSFRDEYTIEINGRYIPIIKWTGIRNVDELKGWLKGKYINIKSEEVLDLPEVTIKDFFASNEPDLELLRAFNAYFKLGDTDKINPTAKAQAALRKVPFTVKYAENLLEEAGCVLIYSDHVEASEAIAKAFKVTALNGKVPSAKRLLISQNFQSGEGRVLVATIGALSTGVNLTRASHIILNDYPWTPGDLKQTIYRIQRIGQKNRCFVHRIIGSPQDSHIMKVCDEKMKTIEIATGE